MTGEMIAAVAMGIGLAASCGFRVFVPLLMAAIAARLGVLPLNEGFAWLGSWPAIGVFATATVVEILAYYVPFVDNLLDVVATPLALGAGALVATSVMPIDGELLRWVTGIIVGGGIAGAVQGGSVLTRLASSKLTGGAGNPVVATGEHAAAVGTSVLALVIPIVVAIGVLAVVTFLIVRFVRLRARAHP